MTLAVPGMRTGSINNQSAELGALSCAHSLLNITRVCLLGDIVGNQGQSNLESWINVTAQ